MDDFDALFPTFKFAVQDLHEGLLVFAYIAMVFGLLLAAYRGMFGNLSEIVRALVAVAVLSITLGYIDDWTFDLGNLVNEYVIDELGTDPSQTHTRFGELIANPADEGEDRAWYEVIFDAQTAIVQALLKGFVFLVAKLAWVIMWWAYMIHKAVVYFGVALAPIFLPLLMINATRGIATRYALGLFALLLWPLGWSVANLMTDALLEAAADRTLYDYGGLLGQTTYGPQMIFFVLLASLWLIASTIGAPIVMTRVLTTGAQIGAALLGGFAGAAVGAMSGGVGGAMAGGANGTGGARGAFNTGAGAVLGGAAAGGSGAVGGPGAGMAVGAGMAAFSMAGAAASTSGGGGGSASGGGGGGGASASSDPNAEAEAIAASASKPAKS